MKRWAFALLAVAAVGGCSSQIHSSAPAVTADNYLSQFVDSTTSPRQDIFQFAVGKWLKDHPIPTSERSWGIGKVVQDETYRRLVEISEKAAKAQNSPGTNAQKIGDFWAAAMDSTAQDKAGMSELQPEFAKITDAKDLQELLAEVAHLHYIGAGPMFSMYIFQDEKNSERNVLHLYQGGLGLPSRDYYFDTDERSKKIRSEYVPHVTRMFELLGDDSTRAKAEAATVMAIETDLARASRKLAALRDPESNYHAMRLEGVGKLTPTIHWKAFLAAGHMTGLDTVIVGQPEFFQQLERSLKGRSLDDWKTYCRWHLATAYAEQAGGSYDAEHFHFFGTVMNGTAEQRARWKRMLDQEEGYLGDALGQLYVQQYFSPQAKARYEKLTDDVFDAFRARIRNLDWMSQATKERALKKLDAVTKKVGYPAKWKDYANYQVKRDSFLGNAIRGNEWQSDYFIAKLYKPVDRTEWGMTPQTYNAYYNPSNNEIVLPAAAFILPGIPDSLIDDAVVYGYAAGTTIGHEITHGFDDEGRQFDEKGNLKSWWTPADEKEFKQRAKRIVAQYNGYVAVDTLHVNGEATQGENIADLGGIQLGWDAFTQTDEYKQGKTLGGYTPAQRYFIGWALGWMNQLRPENLAMRVKTDVHAPSFLRVIGPVTNMPEFYGAYGVKPGDPMYRADDVRVKIW
jgi:putative endopeptidase